MTDSFCNLKCLKNKFENQNWIWKLKKQGNGFLMSEFRVSLAVLVFISIGVSFLTMLFGCMCMVQAKRMLNHGKELRQRRRSDRPTDVESGIRLDPVPYRDLVPPSPPAALFYADGSSSDAKTFFVTRTLPAPPPSLRDSGSESPAPFVQNSEVQETDIVSMSSAVNGPTGPPPSLTVISESGDSLSSGVVGRRILRQYGFFRPLKKTSLFNFSNVSTYFSLILTVYSGAWLID